MKVPRRLHASRYRLIYEISDEVISARRIDRIGLDVSDSQEMTEARSCRGECI